MTAREVLATARALVASDKVLLAMDESIRPATSASPGRGSRRPREARRAYRELIVTTAGLGECISGAILYDETIRQRTRAGMRQRLLEIWRAARGHARVRRQAPGSCAAWHDARAASFTSRSAAGVSADAGAWHSG